ncbi:MAG: type II secretion system F family protein, partial [Verrucomicrobia bacterium]
MPKFNYVAMDSRGKETKGTLDVGSQNEAISRLKEMGYFPTKVIEAGKTKEKPDKKAKVTSADAKGKKKGGGGFNISIKIPGLGGKVKPK